MRPWSAFYASTKWADGTTRTVQGKCKRCQKTYNAAMRKARYHDPDSPVRAKRLEEYRNMTEEQREHARFLKRQAWRARHGKCPERWIDDRVDLGPDITVPAPAFGRWLREQVQVTQTTATELAYALGLDDGTVRRCINRKQATVLLGTVDRALIAADSDQSLFELYPELRDAA